MDETRIVVITGGTSGIGLESVCRFASLGNHVFTCSRHPFDFGDHLKDIPSGRIEHSMVDVGDSQRLSDWIESIGKRQGRIDVLVNNAAHVVRQPIGDFSLEDFRRSLDVNLLGMMQATQKAIPFMATKNNQVSTEKTNRCKPIIVNVSSLAAVDPFPGFSVYGSCKSFVELFTQAIQNELAENGIRCFSIRAGAVDTPLLHRVLPDFPRGDMLSPDRVAELMIQIVQSPDQFPAGRPIEIAKGQDSHG